MLTCKLCDVLCVTITPSTCLITIYHANLLKLEYYIYHTMRHDIALTVVYMNFQVFVVQLCDDPFEVRLADNYEVRGTFDLKMLKL